jgi:hypothetical protein
VEVEWGFCHCDVGVLERAERDLVISLGGFGCGGCRRILMVVNC